MWKAAFSGRSERSEVGSSAGGRKKKSRTSESTAGGPTSRRQSEDKKGNKLTESAIRALDGETADDDGEWEDEDRDARSERRNRKGTGGERDRKRKATKSEKARSRSRDRLEAKEIDSHDSQRRSKMSRSSKSGDQRAGSDRALPDMGSLEQFPGQHVAMLGPPGVAPQPVSMSGALPSSAPNNQFSFGAAADYYNDQGQSVHTQPGVRPVSPNMLVNAAPHLTTPSAQPIPAVDTGNGAAAEFYAPESASMAETGSAKPSKNASKPGKATSSVAMAAGLTGLGALGAAGSSSNGVAQHSVSSQQTSFSSATKPARPPTSSHHASAAAGAGMAAYGIAHHQGTPEHRPQTMHSHPASAHYHEHKGPATRLKDGLLNLISSPEDVQKMEEYTEYIGVCKYCFDPHSSPVNAPRKHHYHKRRDSFEDLRRRRSNERLKRRDSDNSLRRKGSTRVGKNTRYFSEAATSRRDSNGNLITAGLAAAGLATGAAALLNGRKDFDDTYSVKSGHRESSAMRHRSRSSSREGRRKSSHGVVESGSKEEWVTVRTRDGKIERRKVIRRTRSTSQERRRGKASTISGVAPVAPAVAIALGSKKIQRQVSPQTPARRRSSRSPRRTANSFVSSEPRPVRIGRRTDIGSYNDGSPRPSSPQQPTGLFGGFFSTPERDSKRRSKKRGGLFTFSNGSSSSSDSGMAFGDGFTSRTGLPLNKRPSRRSSDRDIAATVAGIGATAAALAAAQKRRKMDPRAARVDLLARRTPHGKHVNEEPEDDEWEDELPSDVDDATSGSDSGLAFGGSVLSHRQSRESVSSGGGGFSPWTWRWGRPKKSRRRVSRHDGDELHDAGVFQDVTPASHLHMGTGQGYGPGTEFVPETNQPPLQYVDPRPLADNAGQSGSRGTSNALPEDWNSANRRSDSASILSPQPVVSQQASFVDTDQPFDDANRSRPYPKRTQSSPVQSSFAKDAAIIGGAALATAGIIASSRKGKDSSKDVRFGLTDEQQRKEDKSAQRRQERADRREREAEEERRRAERAQALKDEASRAAKVEDARIREEEVRKKREAENRRNAELELARQEAYARAEPIAAVQPQLGGRSGDVVQNVPKERDSQRKASQAYVEDARETNGPVTSGKESPMRGEEIAIAAGAIAAATVMASATAARVKTSSSYANDGHDRSSPVLPSHIAEPVTAETYSARKITPNEQTSGSPMMDDDILDKDFFKRKRSDSEYAREARHAEIARKAADKVVSDMDDYYNQPAQDQADFFAPKELLSQSTGGKTRVADPHGDNDVHVFHVEDDNGIYAPLRIPTSVARNKHAPYGIPSLNVIAPTPPPSATSSVRGKGSTPNSPLAQAVNVSEPTNNIDRSGGSDNPRRISWGEDKTHIYDAQTPEEAFEERDSYMDARDVPGSEHGRQDIPSDGVVLQDVSPKDQPSSFASEKDITHSEPSHRADPPYPVTSSSPEEPETIVSSKAAQSPGPSQDTNSPFALSKKERKKIEKEAKSREMANDKVEDDATAPPEPGQVDAWEPPLSKKERKKREKAAARRISLAEEDLQPTSDDISPSSHPEADNAPAEDADEPILSKKDKKKRDKAAKRLSSGMDLLASEREAPVEAEMDNRMPETSPEVDLTTLSKKEKKKAEKELKKQGFADIAAALMTPAGIAAVATVVGSKSEGSGTVEAEGTKAANSTMVSSEAEPPVQEASRMPGSLDVEKTPDVNEVVDPFQFQVSATPPPVEEDDPFEGWSNTKKKKGSKSKKRDSAAFSEPSTSSPLKTTMVPADFSARTQADTDHPERSPQDKADRSLPGLTRTESVASEPTLNQFRPTGFRAEDDLGSPREADPESYDSRSVAASEPVDLYETVRKVKSRSKYDDVDDSSSIRSKRKSKRIDDDDDTASIRSRRDKDDSKESKKEKRGSLLSNLFSRKSTESVPQRRHSVPDAKDESDEDGEQKHRKKRQGDARPEYDEDDDRRSRRESPDSRRKQRRDRDKRDEDSREGHRSRDSSRKVDTDDERAGTRRRSRTADTSPSRNASEERAEGPENDDQSFLGARVEELPPLPASPPESPGVASESILEKGPGIPSSAAQELQPVLAPETPRRASITRPATSTAVPLRFPFGQSKLSPRERGASFSSPVPGSSHTSPTSSHKKNRPSSSEIRPLYLVERNRKTPDVEEALPSLPSSNPSSRSSSVHETDGRVPNEPQEPWQHQRSVPVGLHIDSDHANQARQDDTYLDSAQTTPKASHFNKVLTPARESKPQPQFYTWDDFKADELLHEELSHPHIAAPETGRQTSLAEDLPPLPPSRPGSPHRGQNGESLDYTSATLGAAALAGAAGLGILAYRTTEETSDNHPDNLKESLDHSKMGGLDRSTEPANTSEIANLSKPTLSRKSSKKAKKRSKAQFAMEQDQDPEATAQVEPDQDVGNNVLTEQDHTTEDHGTDESGAQKATEEKEATSTESADVLEEVTTTGTNSPLSRKLSKKEKRKQNLSGEADFFETTAADPVLPEAIVEESVKSSAKKGKKFKKSSPWKAFESAANEDHGLMSDVRAESARSLASDGNTGDAPEDKVVDPATEELPVQSDLVGSSDAQEAADEDHVSLPESPNDTSADRTTHQLQTEGYAPESPNTAVVEEAHEISSDPSTAKEEAVEVVNVAETGDTLDKRRDDEHTVLGDTTSHWSSLVLAGGKKKKKKKKREQKIEDGNSGPVDNARVQPRDADGGLASTEQPRDPWYSREEDIAGPPAAQKDTLVAGSLVPAQTTPPADTPSKDQTDAIKRSGFILPDVAQAAGDSVEASNDQPRRLEPSEDEPQMSVHDYLQDNTRDKPARDEVATDEAAKDDAARDKTSENNGAKDEADQQTQLSTEVDTKEEFLTLKKSKKDKKKTKKSRNSVPAVTNEMAELTTSDDVQHNAVPTEVDQALHAEALTPENEIKPGRVEDVRENTPETSAPTDPRHEQESATVSSKGSEKSIARISTDQTLEPTAAKESAVAGPASDTVEDDEWASFSTKLSKKDKKKKKRQTAVASIAQDPEQSTLAPIAVQSVPTESSRRSTRAEGRLIAMASSVPLPEDGPDEWQSSDPEVQHMPDEKTEPAASDALPDTSDTVFAATLAASLAGTGFDPEIVLKDPSFHRRHSPPASVAEADPEESSIGSTRNKKKKKSKQKTPSRMSTDATVENQESGHARDGDFLDDVLGLSLHNSGFSPDMLAKVMHSNPELIPSADVLGALDRSVDSSSPAKENPNNEQGSVPTEREPPQDAYSLDNRNHDVLGPKVSETPIETSEKDPASDFNVADGREMDIDEMDRQYRSFRKKEKRRKQKGTAQTTVDPETSVEKSEPSATRGYVKQLDLGRDEIAHHVVDNSALAPAAPSWSFAALGEQSSQAPKESNREAPSSGCDQAEPRHDNTERTGSPSGEFTTPTKPYGELIVPKHLSVREDQDDPQVDIRPRTPSGASSSAKTPLEPTSKNRVSYLFQSPPVFGAAQSPSVMNSTARDLRKVGAETSPDAQTVSEEASSLPSGPGPAELAVGAAGALSSIPEEGTRPKRAKPSVDVGGPEYIKAVDRTETPQQMRQSSTPARPSSAGSINTDPRPFSRSSNRSGTPSLRRTDRSVSGDLRAASRRGSASTLNNNNHSGSMRASPRTIPFEAPPTPPSYDDEEEAHPMSDIFQGYGGAEGSRASPTRPPSVRKRQSMQITDLESRLDQLVAENRALHDAQRSLDETSGTRELRDELATRELHLREKDAEISQIRVMLQPLQEEVARLTEINAGLTEANRNLVDDTNGRYGTLQAEHAQAHEQWQSTARELDGMRAEHTRLTTGMRDVVEAEIASALADKNAEILRLREELDVATERVRALQVQVQSNRSNDTLVVRDEDYFDGACQKLCQHVQQWVLRFSKLSDNRVCRLSADINDDKIESRIDNAILDGSDADALLGDRVRRRDVFMCIVMTMAWEYIFTRYLFGMDREQRQKLKSLEKLLAEVGPPRAVAQWRALTLTLLSKRPEFAKQTSLDTEAVAHEIFSVLCTLLPPPSHAENQLLLSLQKVVGIAVDLSIEMRTQRAEYIMLPPLQPEYDSNGDLVRQVHFNASLMNERSGLFSSNEGLEQQRAVVKIVLFPLVVKKGDDYGEGEEEIVVCPAQVLVHNDNNTKGKQVVRVMSGAMEIDDPQRSRNSLVSTAPGSTAF